MREDTKIVIRGVLDQIEDNSMTENKAELIQKALCRLRGGDWSVIVYPSCEASAGCTLSSFHWRSKQWVYAQRTTDTYFNASDIKSFMNTEFGWATISDITAVQQSVNTKINDRFPGKWEVHVAKLNNGYSWKMYGTDWVRNEYTFFIYRSG